MEILSGNLETYLVTLSPATVLEGFLWLILVVFAIAFYQASKGRHSRFLEYAPTLMTSLGILGTFVGIVIGLLHFDTNAIDASIPKLLAGLKTAFITSIAGMFAALLFNSVDAWWFAPKRDNGVNREVTPKDIHAALKDQLSAMEKINQSLAGTEEGSLVGQLKFLRQDVTHFQKQHETKQGEFADKLWKELQGFAEMLSQTATAEIIKALEEVIRDFNNKLGEQFGENFKRLDESVKKLVDWQIEYKNQVEKMGEQYQQSVDSLVHTRTAVAGIWEECKEIPLAMAELKSVLEVNQHQIAELQRHLEAFVLMRQRAEEAVPAIREKLEQIGEQMQSGAVALNEKLEATGQSLLQSSNEMKVALTEGAEGFRDSVSRTQQSFSDMSKEVSTSSEELRKTLGDTSEDLASRSREIIERMGEYGQDVQKQVGEITQKMQEANTSLVDRFARAADTFDQSHGAVVERVRQKAEAVMTEIGRAISETADALDRHMKGAADNTGSTVRKELERIEQATAREIETAMESMGKSLLQITQRFVRDYEEMMKRMEAVVRTGTDGR